MADDIRPGDDDRIYDDRPEPPPRRRRAGRRLMTGLVAIAAILGFGVVLIYAYNRGREDAGDGNPPIIRAQKGQTKERPANPGGMNVPHQDKGVYSRIDTNEHPDKVEKLLPPPETPVQPPTPAAGAAASAEPGAGGVQQETQAQTGAEPGQPQAPPPPAESAPSSSNKLAPPPPPNLAPKQTPEYSPPPEAAPVHKAAPKKAVEKHAPAKKHVVAGRWKIQLASLRSDASAKRSWERLQKRHRALLGDLTLHVEKVTLSGGRGTFYRMQAGPLASRAAAETLCSRLKARKQSCIVVRP